MVILGVQLHEVEFFASHLRRSILRVEIEEERSIQFHSNTNSVHTETMCRPTDLLSCTLAIYGTITTTASVYLLIQSERSDRME